MKRATLIVGSLAWLVGTGCGGSNPRSASSSTGTSTGGASPGTSGTSTGGTGAGTTTGTADAGVAGLGNTCQLDSSGDDPCLTYGLACSDQSGATGECALPPATFPCLQEVGCADPTTTCAGPYISLGTTNWDICAYDCTQTSDCSDTGYACDTSQGACAPSYCGPGVTSGALWADCGVGNSTAAGICYPYNGGGQAGLCTEFGAVALNQPCQQNRDASSPNDLCASGTDCIPLTDGTSFCANLCSPAGSGITLDCPAGAGCIAVIGGVGYCVQSCDPGAAPDTCPSPLRCLNNGGIGQCLP